MRTLKLFVFLLLAVFCCGSLTLSAAPKTLDEINEEQKKKESEEKKAAEETKKKEETPKTNRVAEEEAGKKDETAKNAAEAAQQPAQQTNAPETPAQNASATEGVYTITEEVIGIPAPLAVTQIDNTALMNADPKAVELFESASRKEKEMGTLQNPDGIIELWKQLSEIAENNPFVEIAKARFDEWHSVVALLNKHQENLDKISKLIPAGIIPAEQKVSLISQHLDEFGVTFGTDEILNITKKTETAAEIEKNETFRNKIKEILLARCGKNSGKDCFSNGKNFAVNEEEKLTYFGKACELKYQEGCDETNRVKSAAEAEKARIAAEEKRKAEEDAKRIEDEKQHLFKDELDRAGRKKRLAIATSTLVTGAVVAALGGISFYGMNKAEKNRKFYYKEYLSSDNSDSIDYYRKKANDSDKKRKTYLILGSVGVGVGVALIATGITFYSIEFESEKEVKRKYNVSFGASPMDGTLQFALNW